MALDQWSSLLKSERLDYSKFHSASIEFASGLVLSVQASEQHMCSPKATNPVEGWTTFEVWANTRMTEYDVDILGGMLDEFCNMIAPVGHVTIDELDRVALNNGGITRAVP